MKKVTRRALDRFGPWLVGADRLNIGCGFTHEEGFVNLDCSRNVEADVVADLEKPLPFKDGTFDSVFGSHVFEHVYNLTGLMREIHRILKPNGTVIAITPHGASDAHWENPFHVRGFNEYTWGYYDLRTYRDNTETAGHADFGIDFSFQQEQVALIPNDDITEEMLTPFARRHYRNIFKEVQAILRRVEV